MSTTTNATSTQPQAPVPKLGRPFHLLWAGETVSLLGNATSAVLLPLLSVTMLAVTPTQMGLLTAAAWLPWLVVALPAGAWVDAAPPRRVMIAADLAAAAALASIPVAAWLGVLTWWHLMVVALITGTATVFFRPAYSKLVAQLVPPELLERANARLIGSESATHIVGPGLGGVMARVFTIPIGILIDAASFVVSAICLWRIGPTSPRIGSARPRPKASLFAQIAEGVRFVFSDRTLRAFTIIGGLSNFGLTGYQTLLVLFLIRQVGLTETDVGTVLMVGAVGGLAGTVVARQLSERLGAGRTSTLLLLVSGPSAILIPLVDQAGQIWVSVLGLALVGLTVVAGNVVRGAWSQRYVPDRIMGRTVTARQVVNFGTMPIAAVAAGLLGDRLGVQPAMLTMAAVHAVACLSVLLTRVGRQRDLPAPRAD